MFNLIFNLENEWHCLKFSPGALSLKQSIIFQLKMFVNILAALVLFSLPAIIIILIILMYDEVLFKINNQ